MEEHSVEKLYPAQEISLYHGDFNYERLTRRATDTEHVVKIDLNGLKEELYDFVVDYLSASTFYHLKEIALPIQIIERVFSDNNVGKFPSLREIYACGCRHCSEEITEEHVAVIQAHFEKYNTFIRPIPQTSSYEDIPAMFVCISKCDFYKRIKTGVVAEVLHADGTKSTETLIIVAS